MTDREKIIIRTRITPSLYKIIKDDCENENISIQKFMIGLLKDWYAARTVPPGKK